MRPFRIISVFLSSILLSLFPNAHVESKDKDFSSRTILISFDGAQPEVIEKLLRSEKLPGHGVFAKLIREGTTAERMTSVLPTLTATNHISIATGAYPERTNIPMNSFHLTDAALTATTSGFFAPIDAETLWEAAKRQGKKSSRSPLSVPMAGERKGAVIKPWGLASASASRSLRLSELLGIDPPKDSQGKKISTP